MVADVVGKEHQGVLKQWDGTSLQIGNRAEDKFSSDDLIDLRYAGRKTAISPGDPMVVLANGDRLAVRVDAFDDTALTGYWSKFNAGTPIKVPLETVRGFVLAPLPNRTALERMLTRLLDGTEQRDRVFLKNGDVVNGELIALEKSLLKLSTAVGETTISRDGILAVAFNPALSNMPPIPRDAAILQLSDGSRFHATKFRLGALEKLAMQTQFGVAMDVPLSSIVSVNFLGTRVTYLSDLQPAEYRFTPFFSREWPLQRDRNVAGHALRLRGVEYAKGLGMHSQSEVTYKLDGKYRGYRVTIGIDDETEGKGSVLFKMLADGKPVDTVSIVKTGVDPAVTLTAFIPEGFETITLRVEFATDADVLDHADWCDALVIR